MKASGAAALAGLFGPSPGRASAALSTGRPNIVLILADDLGWGDLGCYGQNRILTPNLDRMAAEGCRFLQYYAGSAVCAPSRDSLMTGRHTGHTDIRGNSLKDMPCSAVTVAETLRAAGYRTEGLGKWGLGRPWTNTSPLEQGFDSWFGYMDHLHAHDYYPFVLWQDRKLVFYPRNFGPGGRARYAPDLFRDAALDCIARNADRPFFLCLADILPHAGGMPYEVLCTELPTPNDALYARRAWPEQQKHYATMVSRLDRTVGAVLDRLVELGIDSNTYVFFASDNGPHAEGGANPAFFQSAGPWFGIKRSLHEGGIRVPLLAWAPGRIAPGTTSDHICAAWDLLPTFAELAGAEPPAAIDGLSMVPTLLGSDAAGRQQEEHDYLYFEIHELGFHQAVRMGRWKGTRNDLSGPIELYDLTVDPGETTDVSSAHPDVVSAILRILETARDKTTA